MPRLFHVLSIFSLTLAGLCAAWITVDVFRRPQHMAVMNVVWPVTALYFGPVAVWAYLRFGRPQSHAAMQEKQKAGNQQKKDESLHWNQVAVATSHCGAGCTIADIVTEFTLFALSATLFGSELWAKFVWDLAAAWLVGIVFQYFSIKPMRNLSVGEGIVAAIKADTFSILAFQVGMYGWMAFVYFVLFPQSHLKAVQPEYWAMMQIGMICGFFTSYPMNWWLVQSGLKEKMG
ncbi:MAG TPA: DUF4396 domain-containing protein [Edaphobacter sp.]|nr:DUF4396 domain-containing protein [Edaphobacter sp.]